MDLLLSKLKELTSKKDGPEANQLVYDISYLAETVLITDAGYCNWKHIDILKDSGFDVYPLETDSWGWLLACIELPCGRTVTYG
jgi:hypothetical protein